MHINAHLTSHPGKEREKNEDNFFFFGKTLENINEAVAYRGESMLNAPILFGVYDGMGGISAGERASMLAADAAKTVISHITDGTNDFEQVLLNICQTANEAICKEMKDALKKRMGSMIPIAMRS